MAYAWLTGTSPSRELSESELARPEIYALRDRISFVGVEVDDTDWSKRLGSEVEVTFADGSTERASVAVYHGHPGDPLSDQELEDRVREAAADRISGARTEQIIEAVWTLDSCEDITDFTRMLVF
jgi:2-methylcitrate dehydratase